MLYCLNDCYSEARIDEWCVSLFILHHFQRAFSSEGLSEMWNEMVKDEEIVFNREESAYPGSAVSVHVYLMRILCS